MHRLLIEHKVALSGAVRPPVCVRQLLGPDDAVSLLPPAGGIMGASAHSLTEVASDPRYNNFGVRANRVDVVT